MTDQLIDTFGRRHNNLRISVTDRCNLRCTYCMEEEVVFMERSELLTFEEITRFVRVAAPLGVDKIRLTGNKLEQKIYRHHSGYPGGLKEVPAKRLRPTRADWMLREAVLGMLPKNKLRALRAKKLRIYLDEKGLARHAGQKPQAAAL